MFRIQLSRALQILVILSLLCSLMGIEPTIVKAAPPITPACNAGVYPCSVWGNGGTPANPAAFDAGHSSIDLGMKFRSDVGGYIKGMRFYKGNGVTGTHIGQLWTAAGSKLAEATFIEDGTGWQEVLFDVPVEINANTTYVATYYSSNGYFAYTAGAFTSSGVDSGPLHVLQNGVDGPNSIYLYDQNAFPTGSGGGANYWVDVIFDVSLTDTTPPGISSVSPADNRTGVAINSTITATFSEAVNEATVTADKFELRVGTELVAASFSYSSGTMTLTPSVPLEYGTTYTATVKAGVEDLVGNASSDDFSWSFRTVTPACTTGLSPCSIWGSDGTPTSVDLTDTGGALELGLKFKSAVNGYIRGIRFYKGPLDTGAHAVHLWTTDKILLEGKEVPGISGSGWQEVDFDSPVYITAGTTYIASSWSASGRYVVSRPFFNSAVTSYPLQATQNVDGTDPNGVFAYCGVSTGCFWNGSYLSSNYWVDGNYSRVLQRNGTCGTNLFFSRFHSIFGCSTSGSFRLF